MKKLNAVLVIDDDPISNFLTSKFIEKSGITDTIILATDGLDALIKIVEYAPLENICPELIITDIEMPVMNGVEFIESFKFLTFENKDQVKIVVNSSTINSAHKENLRSHKVDFYLHKPISTETLFEIVFACQSLEVLSRLKKYNGE
jgi:CheY-like chemotaxis protein